MLCFPRQQGGCVSVGDSASAGTNWFVTNVSSGPVAYLAMITNKTVFHVVYLMDEYDVLLFNAYRTSNNYSEFKTFKIYFLAGVIY